MADQIMTAGSELSVIVPEVWSSKFYDVLLADLPFEAIISKDYEGEISTLGDQVRISTFNEFADAQEIVEGQRNDAEASTATQQSLVINSEIVKDFIVTNRAQMQSLPHMDKLRDLAIYSIQKKIQAKIIALSVPSASAPDHQISYDSGSTLGLADLLEAKELLDSQDVPMENRHVVMGAAQLNDIFNITGFMSSDFAASGGLNSGMVSSPLLGFMPHFTTEVGSVTHLFHSSYFTMASQQGISVEVHDLGSQGVRGMRVNVGWLGGFKQLDSKRIVEIA